MEGWSVSDTRWLGVDGVSSGTRCHRRVIPVGRVGGLRAEDEMHS